MLRCCRDAVLTQLPVPAEILYLSHTSSNVRSFGGFLADVFKNTFFFLFYQGRNCCVLSLATPEEAAFVLE